MKGFYKVFWVVFLFLIALPSVAQKVTITTDDFTGDTIARTSWEKIYSGGLSARNQTRMQVSRINNTDLLLFRIFTNEVCSINKDAEVLIKTNNGIVKAIVTEYTLSEPGAWSANAPNRNLGIYFSTIVNIEDLSGAEIERIRFPLSTGNVDIDISKKDSQKIQKLIQLINNK